jgi:capsule polysaccharide export protein KpsE/RkpR
MKENINLKKKIKDKVRNNKIKTRFYVVQSMTYIHRIKPKGLYYTLISLDKFTIQMIPICRDVERIQKGMKDQIKS